MKTRLPAEIAADLAEIGRLLPKTLQSYAGAYDFAHSSGSSGSGAALARKGASHSDPTGQAAAAGDKSLARSRVRRADRRVWAALGRLREALTALEEAYGESDHYQSTAAPVNKDHVASNAERAELEEKQRQRAARGQL